MKQDTQEQKAAKRAAKEQKILESEKNFGAVKRRELRITQLILIMLMAVLIIVFMGNVNRIQGNAKVINFAGMVRGGTQKLVKEELYGVQDDRMITQMDDILNSMRTGTGRYKGIRLADQNFQDSLTAQNAAWEVLKKEIYAYRANSGEQARLFQMSQDYFLTADRSVSMAQDFSGKAEKKIAIIEWMLIALIMTNALVIVLYGIELGKATRHNMKLHTIAYIDQCTGLPNKRKCEERLSDQAPIAGGTAITCFMFDINNLKKMNDAFGHEAGDQLIAGFGEALRQEALPHMFLGRFGGDEFIGVAVNVGQEDVEAFQKRLREYCDRQTVAGVEGISFACGFAVSTEFPGINISDLMKVADQRMYDNKRRMKGNRVR